MYPIGKGRNRNRNRENIPSVLIGPNTFAHNLEKELWSLLRKYGKEVEIITLPDRDCRKNFLTGMELMRFSREAIKSELDANLFRADFVISPSTLGGGGQGAISALILDLMKDYRDSPIIPSILFTERTDERNLINSVLGYYVSLKGRKYNKAYWLFSNADLLKDADGNFATSNRLSADFTLTLATANNDPSCTFDLSVVSSSPFTGRYAEINLQSSLPENERNILEKAKEMLRNPWLNVDDFIWDDSIDSMFKDGDNYLPDGVVVCLLPSEIKRRIRGLSIRADSDGEDQEIQESDYPLPKKAKKKREREINVHLAEYPGNKIRIATLTQIEESALTKSTENAEKFLRGIHDAVARKELKNGFEIGYKMLYEEEYRTKPRKSEYPWEDLIEN
jgi:hypothetical protein